jgi:hypothetical protein
MKSVREKSIFGTPYSKVISFTFDCKDNSLCAIWFVPPISPICYHGYVGAINIGLG